MGQNTVIQADRTEEHPGVQCDSCGMLPIRGARYRSHVLPDYDVCGQCRDDPAASAQAGGCDSAAVQDMQVCGVAWSFKHSISTLR